MVSTIRKLFGSQDKPETTLAEMDALRLFRLDPKTKGQEYDVDIVAVDGLGGDWRATWTGPHGALWLRDFLPAEIPNARMFAFGYDTSAGFGKGVTNIYCAASVLLNRLVGAELAGPKDVGVT